MKKIIITALSVILVIGLIKFANLYSKTPTKMKSEIQKSYKNLEEFTEIKEILQGLKKATPNEIDKHLESLQGVLKKYKNIENSALYPVETYTLNFLVKWIENFIQILNQEKMVREVEL